MDNESEMPIIELDIVAGEKFDVQTYHNQPTNNLPEIALVCVILTVIVITVAYIIFRRMQRSKTVSESGDGFQEITQNEEESVEINQKCDPEQHV